MADSQRSFTRDGFVGNGVAAGTLAYALGYVVTYLWQSGTVSESLQGYNAVIEFFGGDPVPVWKAVGWLFYNAHNVALTYPALGGGRVSRNLIADGNAPALLYVLPPLVLVVAGFVLARNANVRDTADGARTGATVVVGYVIFAVLGLVAFRHTSGGATMHVEYALGVLLTGVVYPIAFGALGGVLGAITAP